MELGWLEDFLALLETGNFNRAAALRHTTQPAFSRRIKALEDWAGAALFDRSTHRVEPTAAGQAFCRPAEDILRRMQQSRDEMRRIADGAACVLRFAATHALSLNFFPHWRRQTAQTGPIGAVQLTSDTYKSCEQALRQGLVHFFLCHDHPAVPDRPDTAHFLSIKIGTDALIPVSAPDDCGAPRFHISNNSGDPLPLLSYSPESALGWAVKSSPALQNHAFRADVVVVAHLAAVLHQMVRAGSGLAWLPQSMVQSELDDGSLLRAGPQQWDEALDIRLYRPRARQSPAVEEFWAAAAAAADQTFKITN